ncbi:hypothetical protein VNO78_05651 [Psophocarpus tetragonolobus]|uniref:Transcription factor CBF/NF-Y/archaeal histone domain-containing protein n=1 Tax=Psophocarpus tetragonolobus TaxID=3891 RepID=A0AAN9XQX0_PSOTE
MASSNTNSNSNALNPNPEIYKTKKSKAKPEKNAGISKSDSKTKKNRDIEEENKTAKNKKAKLSNGSSKQGDQGSQKGAEPTAEDVKKYVFPLNRIRTMLKGEDPNMRVAQEALFAINNATEKFLQQFAQDAYASCVQDRKKSLSYDHLANAVTKQRRYDFLSDFVPQRVRAEDALRERSSAGRG